MEKKNFCYTVFYIVGKFDPDKAIELLGVPAHRIYRSNDTTRGGFCRGEAILEIGKCDDETPYIYKQMEKTISTLSGKTEILKKIREENDVKFYLSVVPEIYSSGVHPCLSPSLAVIDFCHETRTELDIDLYILDEI